MADSDSISITCPHCESTTTKSMPWAMTHFTTRCTECRKAFPIDRGYLLRTIQRLDFAMKALSRRS